MINKLRDFMTETGMSQKQIASSIGKSSATINQYLQSKYKGDTAAIDIAVAQLIERHTDKQATTMTEGFVATPTAKRCLEVIKMAHVDNDITVIYGDAGLGKTEVLTHYANQHAEVIFIKVDPTYTAKVLLTAICDELSLPIGKSLNDLMRSITERLSDSNRLILVDEAELLPYRALESLRRIHDKTGVGICLAGMPRLIANLKGRRGEYSQLYSRVGFAQPLGNELSTRDTGMLATALLGTDNHNAALHKVCKGNARRLSKVIRNVKRTAKINNKPITDAMINEVGKLLIH